MKKALLLLIIIGFAAQYGCQKVSSQADLEKIRELEEMVKQNRKDPVTGATLSDTDILSQLGEAYVDFVENYPAAPETPEYCFRAGELYSNELNDLPKSLELFEKNYKEYPEHETAANALFFTGYLYHNSLRDLIKAEKAYNEFLEKYPNHNMADHARFELESLGMPVEEVFEKILRRADSTRTDSITPAP